MRPPYGNGEGGWRYLLSRICDGNYQSHDLLDGVNLSGSGWRAVGYG